MNGIMNLGSLKEWSYELGNLNQWNYEARKSEE